MYFTAPTAPPSAFHVVVINSTAVEFQWELPLLEHRNGIIQGYKLFITPLNQNEEEIVIASNQTTEYIVSGLTPNTVYTCSILAYTVGDGPRSVLLRVTTPDESKKCCILYMHNINALSLSRFRASHN